MSLDFLYLSLGSDQIDYVQAWELQRTLHGEVAAGQRGDTALVLEHASVYTAGKRTEVHERPLDGTPVVDVDRGGKITWHGPGQLVVYPLVRLPEPVGVVDYVRRLEEAMIATFAELGLVTGRVRGRSGVWVAADATRPERKVAAIGVRVAAGVTMHGVAINVDPDLTQFDKIVPCGLSDVGVTSLAAELGVAPSLTELAYVFGPHLDRLLRFEPYVQSPDLDAQGPDARPAGAGPTVTYGLTVGAA